MLFTAKEYFPADSTAITAIENHFLRNASSATNLEITMRHLFREVCLYFCVILKTSFILVLRFSSEKRRWLPTRSTLP